MNGGGDQFLAGPAFTANQHRGVGRRNTADAFEQLIHDWFLANQMFKMEFVCFFGVALQQAPMLKDLVQLHLQGGGVEGLENIIVGACLHCPNRFVGRINAGQDQDKNVRVAPKDFPHKVDAVHAGHRQVGEDDIGGKIFEHAQG